MQMCHLFLQELHIRLWFLQLVMGTLPTSLYLGHRGNIFAEKMLYIVLQQHNVIFVTIFFIHLFILRF